MGGGIFLIQSSEELVAMTEQSYDSEGPPARAVGYWWSASRGWWTQTTARTGGRWITGSWIRTGYLPSSR